MNRTKNIIVKCEGRYVKGWPKWNEMKKSHIKLKREPQAIDIRNELWATGFLINKREDERAEVKIYR